VSQPDSPVKITPLAEGADKAVNMPRTKRVCS